MKTKLTLVLAAAALALGAGSAVAGGSEGSIGVGAEGTIGEIAILPGFDLGLGGLSMNYDAGKFHAGGFLGFNDGGGDDDTFVALGGRFYYHIHSTAMADFGVGATVGIGFIGDGNDATDNGQYMLVEPGMQTRAFVASNVALSFSAGLTLGLVDAEGVAVGGHLTASGGVHYYFF